MAKLFPCHVRLPYHHCIELSNNSTIVLRYNRPYDLYRKSYAESKVAYSWKLVSPIKIKSENLRTNVYLCFEHNVGIIMDYCLTLRFGLGSMVRLCEGVENCFAIDGP